MTVGSITAILCAVVAITFASLAIREIRRSHATAETAAPLLLPPETIHIDGRLVDFSPTVLGNDGEPVCTCTLQTECLRCYEESL